MDLTVIHQCISVKYYGELPGYSRGVGAELNGNLPIGGFGGAQAHRVDHYAAGTAALRFATNGQSEHWCLSCRTSVTATIIGTRPRKLPLDDHISGHRRNRPGPTHGRCRVRDTRRGDTSANLLAKPGD